MKINTIKKSSFTFNKNEFNQLKQLIADGLKESDLPACYKTELQLFKKEMFINKDGDWIIFLTDSRARDLATAFSKLKPVSKTLTFKLELISGLIKTYI